MNPAHDRLRDVPVRIPEMRRYYLATTDGERIADGVLFTDGTAVTRWCRMGYPTSTVVFPSRAAMEHVHTQLGTWQLIYLDAEDA